MVPLERCQNGKVSTLIVEILQVDRYDDLAISLLAGFTRPCGLFENWETRLRLRLHLDIIRVDVEATRVCHPRRNAASPGLGPARPHPLRRWRVFR